MINAESVSGFLQEELKAMGLFLVDVIVRPGNKISVYIDSMKGVTLEECIVVNRFIENKLDRNIEDFELEVSSPGLDRPLKLPVQFEKNIGRMLEVVKYDGMKTTGRLLGTDHEGIKLETEVIVKEGKKGKRRIEYIEQPLKFEVIKTAIIVISLKSKIRNGKP